MSDPEKPLHVRVAEALGWTIHLPCLHDPNCHDWYGVHPTDWRSRGIEVFIPCYDTDWSATGPLIEKYDINVLRGEKGWYAVTDLPWVQELPDFRMLLDGDLPLDDPAQEPLLAVCYLLLALHQAGKLK